MQIARSVAAGLFLAVGLGAAQADTARLRVRRAVLAQGDQPGQVSDDQ